MHVCNNHTSNIAEPHIYEHWSLKGWIRVLPPWMFLPSWDWTREEGSPCRWTSTKEEGVPECMLFSTARDGLRSTGGSTTAGGERREKVEEKASERGREWEGRKGGTGFIPRFLVCLPVFPTRAAFPSPPHGSQSLAGEKRPNRSFFLGHVFHFIWLL
jgi:hypothetical protein